MDDAQTEAAPDQPAANSALDSQELDHLVDEHIAELQQEREAGRRRMEFIKFGILAAILLGTVLVLAIARPLVFDRVVPSVMGEGQSTNADIDSTKPDVEETMSEDGAAQPTAVPEEGTQDPNQGGGAPDASTENTDAAPPTAVPAQIYVVQAGDTLNSIARQFNTSVEAIMAANNIQNPDSLLVGATLNIPQP